MAIPEGIMAKTLEERSKHMKFRMKKLHPNTDEFVEMMQNKLEIRRKKYPSYKKQTKDELYKHLLEEQREVTTAFILDKENELLGELIDLSNMCLLLYKKIKMENKNEV